VCRSRLDDLIDRTLTDLEGLCETVKLGAALRVKIITIITIDVHGRDVLEQMVQKKTSNVMDFMWQKQLRFEFNDIESIGMKREAWRDPKHKTALCKICDWIQE